MRAFSFVIAFILSAFAAPLLAQEEPLPPELLEFLDQLDPQTGQIEISVAEVTIELGEEYVYYSPQDTEKILVQAWGNPPEAAIGVLGMVMPAGTTPFTDAWGAIISFDKTGYVSDEDAADADYDDLMEDIQSEADESNERRLAAGYGKIQIIGWAKVPEYEVGTHSVVWAQEIDFSDAEERSLNYDVRTLGRKGVLSLNLVSTMPHLESIEIAAADFVTHAQFNPGARYEDFNDETDERAGYGIAGLVAGGAGLAVAKKFGLLAIFLKFLKPILIGVVALLAVFRKRIAGLFGIKSDEEYEEEYEEEYVEDYEEGSELDPSNDPLESDEVTEAEDIEGRDA